MSRAMQQQQQVQHDDDLIDDLMSIVKTDDQVQDGKSKKQQQQQQQTTTSDADDDEEDECGGERRRFDNDEFDDELEDDEYEDEHDDEDDEDDGDEVLIDEMLEKPIDLMQENDQVDFYTYNKLQIKSIYWRGCQDTILPEGWVQVTHACGMPLFLNRQTRVCTASRPYYIGQASARKHDVPMSAVPCLAYRRRKEAVERQIKEHQQAKYAAKCPFASKAAAATATAVAKDSTQTSADTATSAATAMATVPVSEAPSTSSTEEKQQQQQQSQQAVSKAAGKKVVVSIQTNEEKMQENMLTPDQLNQYCRRLFEFDVIKVKKFKTWGDRKKFLRKSKKRKFPENAKMLKIQTKTQKGINKELNINMTNKTPLSILYEYTSQIFKTNPRFEIQEKENPKDPFHAVCYINDKVSGRGSGNSKKAAKSSAAEAALCVLVPEFKSQTTTTTTNENSSNKNNEEMCTFFDGFSVEHTHVIVHSQKLGSPMPYEVLLTCLKYNFAINMSRNSQQFIEEEIKPIKYGNCLYRMKLAQYDVEVNCSKKKEGRQFAAQKVLKLMHPHVQTWGSILRLYGSKINEAYLDLEKQQKSQAPPASTEAAVVGDEAAAANTTKAKPNKELLDKLKEEMRKLKRPTTTQQQQQQQQQATPASAAGDASANKNEKSTSAAAAAAAAGVESILTIPPLLLGTGEFKLSSNSFLMLDKESTSTADDKQANGGGDHDNEDDGTIMMTCRDDALTSKGEENDGDEKAGSSKRKLNIYLNGEDCESDDDDNDEDDNAQMNRTSLSSTSTATSSSSSSSSHSSASNDEDEDGEI